MAEENGCFEELLSELDRGGRWVDGLSIWGCVVFLECLHSILSSLSYGFGLGFSSSLKSEDWCTEIWRKTYI